MRTIVALFIALALVSVAAAQSAPVPGGSIPAGTHIVAPGQTYTFNYPARDGYQLWISGLNGCIGGPPPGPNWQTPVARPLAGPVTILRWSGLQSCVVEIWYVPAAGECRGPGCPVLSAGEAVGRAAAGLPSGGATAAALQGALNNSLLLWIVGITVGGLLAWHVIGGLMAALRAATEHEAIQREAELYEYLRDQGYDRDVANDLAVGWRERYYGDD